MKSGEVRAGIKSDEDTYHLSKTLKRRVRSVNSTSIQEQEKRSAV